jgi:hypothetical protein
MDEAACHQNAAGFKARVAKPVSGSLRARPTVTGQRVETEEFKNGFQGVFPAGRNNPGCRSKEESGKDAFGKTVWI